MQIIRRCTRPIERNGRSNQTTCGCVLLPKKSKRAPPNVSWRTRFCQKAKAPKRHLFRTKQQQTLPNQRRALAPFFPACALSALLSDFRRIDDGLRPAVAFIRHTKLIANRQKCPAHVCDYIRRRQGIFADIRRGNFRRPATQKCRGTRPVVSGEHGSTKPRNRP